MRNITLLKCAAIVGSLSVVTPAMAQDAWIPGTEILGQPVVVTTNGVTNTLYFDPGGTVRLVSPGNNVTRAAWSVANNQLCINNGSAAECWPYNTPFQAQQPQTLTSNCNSVSVWTAQAVNQPTQNLRGERGK